MSRIDAEAHTISAWSTDFVRALGERPKIMKWLFKLVIGRYAWREFAGMYKAIPYPEFGYDLKNNEYHKEHPEVWGMK
jgi:hypothetical protein